MSWAPRRRPGIEVFNKSDHYAGEIRPHGEDIVSVSAKTGEGLDELLGDDRRAAGHRSPPGGAPPAL